MAGFAASVFLAAATFAAVVQGVAWFQLEDPQTGNFQMRYYLLPANIALAIGWAVVFAGSVRIARRDGARRGSSSNSTPMRP
jgi:hypothetical protein